MSLLALTLAAALASAQDTTKPPTEAELKALTVELPYVLPGAELKAFSHVILHDASGKGSLAVWHEPQWKRQAELVKDKLIALGVQGTQIQIHPVAAKAEVETRVKAVAGPKKLYFFGHAGTLKAYIGTEAIALPEISQLLLAEKVDSICHYGCSFVNADENDLLVLQKTLGKEQRLTLYGHRKVSSKTDDSPWAKDNPIQRCEVGKDCSRLYDPQREMAARQAKLAKFSLESIPAQYRPHAAISAMDMLAAYDGGKPEKLPPPPDAVTVTIDLVSDGLKAIRGRLADRLSKKKTK